MFYIWTIVISNMHQRLIWWFSVQSKISCRLYISDLLGRKYDQIIESLKQRFSRAFQWKMNFKSNPTKQTQEVNFNRKLQNSNYPCFIFNHNTVNLTESQKRLRMVLDFRLDFKECLEIISKNISKTIGLLGKLQNLLPRKSFLITVINLLWDHIWNMAISFVTKPMFFFQKKLELIQCNFAITGALRGSSKKKLY